MDKEKEKELRKEKNKDILERMKQGDPLQYPSQETWFQPRKIIKKDKKLVSKVYQIKPDPKD